MPKACCRQLRQAATRRHADPVVALCHHPLMEPTPAPRQKHNPLHGLTLETILSELVAYYDWPGLNVQIELRCFQNNPSLKSSLKFLRQTPWARDKVESLYLFMQREIRREGKNPAVSLDPGKA